MDMDFNLFRQVADNAEDERNVAARFYDKAVKTEQTTATGLPVFKNVTYVEIRLKDNSTEVFNQPATPDKIKRFPREYALYCQSKAKVESGTPINQFAFLTAAEVATCHSRGILTVEALADLSQQKAIDLGLSNEAEKARLFSNAAKAHYDAVTFAAKEKEYQSQISALKTQITTLKSGRTFQPRHRVYHNQHYKGGKK